MQIELTHTHGQQLNYLLYLPTETTENSRPLILFLHGAGERGDDLSQLKKHGIPKIVDQDPNFPFIAVSPQCPTESRWINRVDILKSLLDHVQATYLVDSSRIYLTGLSMGGQGAWWLAAAYPDYFAAVVPICGRTYTTSSTNSEIKSKGGWPLSALVEQADRIKDLPLWVFHGAEDSVVPLQHSQEMVSALKGLDSHVRFTIYPGVGHDSWTKTYDNPQLYQWLLQHRSSNSDQMK